MARWPLRAIAAATWISRVDLPMPGSPPTSSTEPLTKPPPVTRSNSATPDASLGASCAVPVSGSSANGRPFRDGRMAGASVAPAVSSTMVFHSPQASHLPCQRPVTAPQFWQTKVMVRRAIWSGLVSRLGLHPPGRVGLISPHVHAPIAPAEAGQDLVGDRAGVRGKLVDPDFLIEQRREIAPARNLLGQVGDIDGQQVHGDAAGECTAPAGDDGLGAGLGVGRARRPRHSVGITECEN